MDVALDVLEALVAIHPDSQRLSELDRKKHGDDLSDAEYHEWMELQEHGLVHRDIKPLNIIMTRSCAKLLDFNIASRVGDPVYTQSGTPPFQPPDADLTRWDVSTDLFVVGVVLYEGSATAAILTLARNQVRARKSFRQRSFAPISMTI